MSQEHEQEFKSWREIEKFQGVHVIISEKVHGSAAQVLVYKDEFGELHAIAGSRTRFLNPLEGIDNFGFGTYVKAHEKEICEKLGEGRHFGEWAGIGVNSSYNFNDKYFVLFDYNGRFKDQFDAGTMPPRMLPIPILYNGPYSSDVVERVLEQLKTCGSVLAPNFMNPEGIVLFFPQFNSMKKKVFKPEETGWIKKKEKVIGPKVDYLETARPFLQPIRLEKLLMRDETYCTNFPQNLPIIVKAYLEDLTKETLDLTEEKIKAVKKKVFEFVKEEVNEYLTKKPIITNI